MAYENRDYTHLTENEKQKIELIAQAIRNKAYGIDVRESIALAIEWVNREYKLTIENNMLTLKEFENAKAKVSTLELDMDEFIQRYSEQIAGNTSLDETIDARVDATGVSHTTLKDRLDSDSEEVAEIKTDNAEHPINKLSAKQLSAIRVREPLVSFSDDDGNKAILTKLKPISEDLNIPFNISLLVSLTKNGSGISVEEAKDLQDRLGWEVLSHGTADVALGNTSLTESQIEEQVRDGIVWFRERGLNVKNYCYPGGQASASAKRIVSKYANAAIGTGIAPNTYPLDNFNINRLPFPASAPNNTLDYYKSKVDEAIANNQWLVWMLHCGMVEFDATQQQHLRDLIVYIKSKLVDITTIQGGLDKVGNIIDINQRQFYMSADGANNIINTLIQTTNLDGTDKVKFSDLPNTFPKDKVTVSIVNNNRSLSPTGRGGVLITTTLTSAVYSSQTFIDQGGRQFTRHAITETTWSRFNAVTISKDKISVTLPPRTVAAGTSFWQVVNNGDILASDAHIAQPKGTLEQGLTWSCWSHGNAVLVLEIYNPTKNDILMTERVFDIHRFN